MSVSRLFVLALACALAFSLVTAHAQSGVPTQTVLKTFSTMSLHFTGPATAVMSYNVDGVSGTETILKQPF
ncbi:MAG TPA: hypothetical protein VFE23_14750 [Usitatibacter sp.]|jgi:hypothetical protein|nr:hypothetical protein [Usitatibacter sp.]